MNEELKTLEDITEFRGATWEASENVKEELRQEAIKWIKDIQENTMSSFYTENEYPLWQLGGADGVIRFIQHFFNISEEDIEEFEDG